MSFEGYYQVLCGNKHYHTIDCYHYEHEAFVCGDPIDGESCEAGAVWDNLVDDTNCDSAGKVEMVCLTDPVYKRCDLGHDHVWTAATWAAMTKGPLGLLADQAE